MGLRAYIIRRVLLMVPTLIGVTLLIFGVTQFFSPYARAVVYMKSPASYRQVDRIIAKYHLNDSVFIQYKTWMEEVLQGNLGYSQSLSMPVRDALLKRFPGTLELVIFALPPTIILGIYLGVKSAVHRDKAIDHVTRSLSIIGWSLPTFWLAILLLAVFYGQTGWFPPERLGTAANIVTHSANFVRYTGLYTIDGLLNGQLWITLDALRHLVLPVTTLTIVQIALIIRVMRSSMLEALNKGYMATARAKGLSKNAVINKHARRNALIPVVTISGILAAGMLTGVVITETVFALHGIGEFAASAATQLDIAAVLGFALLSGIVFVMANLIVDIAYAYVDPRIRLG